MNSGENSSDTPEPGSPPQGVSYPGHFSELARELCASASRTIRILSPILDPVVFDNADMADAISALARRDSHSRVQILIRDSRPMVQNGHRLLTLARRLPSAISIRKLAGHPEMTGETMVIRDLDGLLVMPADGDPGYYRPDSRASARQCIDRFDALWRHGVQDPEFRRLGL